MYHSVEAVLSMHHSFLRKVNCSSHGLTCILLTTCMDVCPVLLLPSYLVICAHVQQDGEAMLGRHPPAGCIQCQLANWDAHPIAAQVSQPQDPLPIRHTDSLWRDTNREPQEPLTFTFASVCRRIWLKPTSQVHPEQKHAFLFPQTEPGSTPSWLSAHESLYCLAQNKFLLVDSHSMKQISGLISVAKVRNCA